MGVFTTYLLTYPVENLLSLFCIVTLLQAIKLYFVFSNIKKEEKHYAQLLMRDCIVAWPALKQEFDGVVTQRAA